MSIQLDKFTDETFPDFFAIYLEENGEESVFDPKLREHSARMQAETPKGLSSAKRKFSVPCTAGFFGDNALPACMRGAEARAPIGKFALVGRLLKAAAGFCR